MLKTLKNTLLSGTALLLFTGCTSSGIDRGSLDTAIQEYYASVISVQTVKLKSDIPEGAIVGASVGLAEEIDGDSEDMISGLLAGVLVGSLFTAVEEGSSDATRYTLYAPDKGEFDVVTQNPLPEETRCVTVRQNDKVALYPVDIAQCKI